MQRTYTTFQVAELCGVKPTTIIKWVKENRIKAYVTPGGHRRIEESDLIHFLKQYRFPIPEHLVNKMEKRIVIVEDEASSGKLLERSFKEAFQKEAAVEWIQNGIEAMLELGKKPADLVILDVVMPVIDGAKVLATLRADPQTAKMRVIGMTGKRLSGDKLDFMEKNVDAFFYKPFDIHEVIRKSRELMGLLPTVPADVAPRRSRRRAQTPTQAS